MESNAYFPKILITTLCLLVFGFVHAQEWTACGGKKLSKELAHYPNLSRDADGNLFVLFNDSQHNEKATVMTFDGKNWSTVGEAGFSNFPVIQRGDIEISDSGEPWVILTTNKGTGFWQMEVWAFRNSSWENIGPAIGQGVNIEPKLTFYRSKPYIAFTEPSNRGWGISVMQFEQEEWTYVGSPSFGPKNSYPGALTIHKGRPYISFADSNNGYCATVMKYNGYTWEHVGLPGFSSASGGGQVFWADLEISPFGMPYISYIDSDGNGANVMKYNGTTWVHVGAMNVVKAQWIDLAFNKTVPYIALQDIDASRVTVMSFTGKKWQSVGNQWVSKGATNIGNLEFYKNTPFLVFVEAELEQGLHIMKLGFVSDWMSMSWLAKIILLLFISMLLVNRLKKRQVIEI